MKHDYDPSCLCYRCKGIRNSPNFVSPGATGNPRKRKPYRKLKVASREEQHGRYLDCGPQAWDDRD